MRHRNNDDFLPFVSPSDYKVIAAARKRGGERAAARVRAALARRIAATVRETERKTAERIKTNPLMVDATDHAFPPSFLQRPTKASRP
jgi:hypothetical protein